MSKLTLPIALVFCFVAASFAGDRVREIQKNAIETGQSDVAHWGWQKKEYALWTTHSNRLTPVYTYGTKEAEAGIDLGDYMGANSPYRKQDELLRLYGRLPRGTLSTTASYLDQTNIYQMQLAALKARKKYIFLVIFDGMDWQTTRATSIHNLQRVAYAEGRGIGTHFQDYTADGTSQFGFMVTSPHNDGTEVDVDLQIVKNPGGEVLGGYDPRRGGFTPWQPPRDPQYLLTEPREAADLLHAYTDSASSATSMMAGIKTYNKAINVDVVGQRVATIAHLAQAQSYKVGAVSSVPISHATPAAAYAHNVYRNDHQDATRDMLGLPTISHPDEPLPGLDVLIGGGYGVVREEDEPQGKNFVPGNVYLTENDLRMIDVANGGRYVVASRQAGVRGVDGLIKATVFAATMKKRLLGFYGAGAKGHLPYQTANGDYQPTLGREETKEEYTTADIDENPTLADMTRAALRVLETNEAGFWLLVEPGDVDWANHDCNLDNAIGAVNSGDDAVRVITDWVEQHSSWRESMMIVTADHGHYMFLDRPELLIDDAE